MDKMTSDEDRWYHREKLLVIFLRVVVSLALLAGGIVVLALRISGWGILIGLPMVIFGSVFIIYTYDEVLSRHIQSHKEDHENQDDERI